LKSDFSLAVEFWKNQLRENKYSIKGKAGCVPVISTYIPTPKMKAAHSHSKTDTILPNFFKLAQSVLSTPSKTKKLIVKNIVTGIKAANPSIFILGI